MKKRILIGLIFVAIQYLGGSQINCVAMDDSISNESGVSFVAGDVNCDGSVDMSDAVMIMQALANPNKYGLNGTAEHHLTEQGKLNGDMDRDGLTVGDAQVIQRKLLGLEDLDGIPSIVSSDIAGKTFISENNGVGNQFTLSFSEDGTYKYYKGDVSSYIGSGLWIIDGDIVVLTEKIKGNVIRLKAQKNVLIYIEEGSDNFYYIQVNDGERFLFSK